MKQPAMITHFVNREHSGIVQQDTEANRKSIESFWKRSDAHYEKKSTVLIMSYEKWIELGSPRILNKKVHGV